MRILIYVNTNPTEKHITIHCEQRSPCGDVFKQLLAETTKMRPTIEDLTKNKEIKKEIIKIAVTDNSYWLLMWIPDNVKDVKQYVTSNSTIQKIMKDKEIKTDKINIHC